MATPEFLVLKADFLAGTYGGAEWPPAPFRLLQAIVAGHRSIEVPGLSWLERQGAPLLCAPAEPSVVRFKRSIPNNADPRTPQAALSLREVLVRRVLSPVLYCYPLRSQEDRAAAEQVMQAVRQVHTLGTGEDMCAVTGSVVADTPETLGDMQLWIPLPTALGQPMLDSDALLRVPVPGSLESLEERFQAFQNRLSQGEKGYARPVQAPALHAAVAYRTSADVPRTAAVALRLVGPDDAKTAARFHAADAVVVAGMLRHAAMRLAGSLQAGLDDFAAGYGPQDDLSCRMSWVPLPSVGHRHADGLIRRGLWLARASDLQKLAQIAQAIPAEGMPLVDEETGECVALAVPEAPEADPVAGRFLGHARSWTSVTPMILPGDLGGNDQRVVNKLLRKALKESGIDPGLIEHAEFSKSGFSRQAVPVSQIRLKQWEAKALILYHVRIRFRQAIRGPVVLGRGRHFGVGLFSADPE